MFIAICAVLALLCVCLGVLFIRAMEQDKQLKATILKGLTTVCCILIAIVAISHSPDKHFARLIVFGLIFGCLGDVLLALRFVFTEKFNTMFLSGAFAFLVGHIFYVLALYSVAPQAWKLALPLVVVALGFELFNSKKHELDMGKLFAPLGVYAAFVCFMGCSAVSTCVSAFSIGTLLFAVAGVCFIASDSVLSVQCFGKNPDNRKNRILHVLYWLAQLLISVSPMLLTTL